MRILLSNLLAKKDDPQDINALFLKEGIASSRRRFEDATLLDSHLLRPNEIEQLRPTVHDAFAQEVEADAFIKTHDAYTHLADGTPVLGRAAAGAIYLIRDPRDVAVSLAHFWACPLEVAIAFLNNPEGCLNGNPAQTAQKVNGWSGHARSWLDQTDLPVHVARYEDLLTDTMAAFGSVLEFFGVGATDTEIARAVQYASFGELKRQEQEKGFRETADNAAVFFREGRAGAWREILGAEQQKSIELAHGELMAQYEYL